jgi:hypothetical protein
MFSPSLQEMKFSVFPIDLKLKIKFILSAFSQASSQRADYVSLRVNTGADSVEMCVQMPKAIQFTKR